MKYRIPITCLAIAGIAAAAITLRPKPPEHGISDQGVRDCLVAVSQLPTEFAASRGYTECLAVKREAERVARWQEHGKAVAARNQRCSDLGYWKPGSKLGSECSIPEPRKPLN
jgi:hypothetical protein